MVVRKIRWFVGIVCLLLMACLTSVSEAGPIRNARGRQLARQEHRQANRADRGGLFGWGWFGGGLFGGGGCGAGGCSTR